MDNSIYNFFWWLAGANREILKEHREDHDKYFQIGMAILTTALMAVLTSAIAFHYAINRGFGGEVSPFAILAGIFWGFIILNLDRFLVLSMKKQGNSIIPPTPYEKFQYFKQEFIFAVPRIVLAVLIASIILQPLELYLFQDQISNQIPIINEKEQKQIRTIQDKKIQEQEEAYTSAKKAIEEKYNTRIDASKIKRDNKKGKLSNLSSFKDERLIKLKEELKSARDNSAKNRISREKERSLGGCGDKCKELGRLQTVLDENIRLKLEKINKIQNELGIKHDKDRSKISEIETQIDSINREITLYESNKSEEIYKISETKKSEIDEIKAKAKRDMKNHQGSGIMIALVAKDSIFDKEDSPYASKYDAIHTLLWLLLLVIELLPLIVKLILDRSSYDAHIQRISEDESLKHDTFMRDKRIKSQMEFKAFRMEQKLKVKEFEEKLNSSLDEK